MSPLLAEPPLSPIELFEQEHISLGLLDSFERNRGPLVVGYSVPLIVDHLAVAIVQTANDMPDDTQKPLPLTCAVLRIDGHGLTKFDAILSLREGGGFAVGIIVVVTWLAL